MPISKSSANSAAKQKDKVSDDEDQGASAGARDQRSHEDDDMIEETKLQQVLLYHQELAKVDKQDKQL